MPQKYILITAAKNEEAHIAESIRSVLRQTILPEAWFIVDDGSTDRTAAIIRRFQYRLPLICLHPDSGSEERNFGSQYRAIQGAYRFAEPLTFDAVGIQDADIAPVRNDYYEAILARLRSETSLGIAGGYVCEQFRGRWRRRVGNATDSVAGGIQMFRRACFDEICGYRPLRLGGSDWLAQIEARRAGWEVRAFPDLEVLHFRPTSSSGGRIRGLIRLGMMDASFGSRFGFEVLKCLRRLGERPVVGAAFIRFCGYIWWTLKGIHAIPPEAVRALREEQSNKMRSYFRLLPAPMSGRCRSTG